jgi:hypothetical protein
LHGYPKGLPCKYISTKPAEFPNVTPGKAANKIAILRKRTSLSGIIGLADMTIVDEYIVSFDVD